MVANEPRSERSAHAGTVLCEQVGKIWNAGTARAHPALEEIDLVVSKGEFVVMIGPSGCGKSTLLYLMSGLEQPTSGRLEMDEQPITKPGPDRCLIFQETSLYPWLSVGENVAFGLKLRGRGKAERRQIAERLLSVMGLASTIDKRPSELSGGMRQRVAIARALAMDPEVLLMDEPFAALDVQTRSKLQEYLVRMWEESGASVVFVTHHIDEAVALADRVVVFTAQPGRIKSIIPIDLPRPRNPRSEEFRRLSDELTDQLSGEVDRAFQQQEQGVPA